MTHNNTVLAQLLKFIDRHDFQTLENGQFLVSFGPSVNTAH